MFVRLGMPLPYLFIATFAASLLAVELIKANPKLGTKQAPSKTFSSFAKKLRRQSQNPFLQEAEEPDFGESSQQSLVHHPNILPQLELVDIETFCFGNVNFLSLGSCSSTFLRCGQFSERRQYDFEECPLGEIFHNTRCRPAFEVKDCFNTEVNLLNDATEKLAQTTNFCARSPFESALYSSSPVNGPDHKCSRQAMLCRNSAPPLALSCSSEQVLDTKTLRCVDAPSNVPLSPALFFAPYVTCHAPTIEIVFCDSGKIFDPSRHGCRRVQAEDQCPLIGVCKGWEWRTVPLGECKNNFLFCNAMRPTMFQCQVKGAIFKDGHCRAPEDQVGLTCGICRKGDRKRAETCDEECFFFYFCENHKTTGNLHWQAYRCVHPRVFSPFVKECVLPNEYHCPNRIQCREGDSFATSCSDFFYCYEGKYLQSKCPHLTRWDQNQRRCISDESCHQFQDRRDDKTCQSGEAKPSVDCQSFEECGADGRWTTVDCKEYSTDRLKAPCRFCDKVRNRIDTYPVDTMLPRNFNPFDGQGVRQKQCVDGEKIVNKQDCDRYMECVDGEWFNLACPTGYFFDSKTQICKTGDVDCKEEKFNSDFSSVYLPPLYNQSHAQDNMIGFGNGVGPTPKIPVNYKDKYTNSFEFCEKSSPSRLPNPYDCSKYKECALDLGGYYTEQQCPPATQFDPASGHCKYDFQCVAPKCVEGIREPKTGQCGKARRCYQGKWEDVRCKNNMAFINGKCSSTISCDNANSQYSHGSGQCINQHTKAHYSQCSKYLVCQHGQFVEESCYNGDKYNSAIGRCDPSHKCKSDRYTDCYEGELQVFDGTGKSYECDKYKLCIDGKFEAQVCPLGQIFDINTKRCKIGSCPSNYDGNNESYESEHNKKTKCSESSGKDAFRPDGNDCNRFYQCAQGDWVSKSCAAGLAFSPSIGVCDWPRNVPGC